MLDRADHCLGHHSGRLSDPAGLEVVFVDLGTSGALLDASEEAVPRLSAGDHARVQTLAADQEHQRFWRRARIATRIVLERAAGPGVRKADFVIAAGGRPLLRDGLPYFSVAHSGSAALVAVSHAAPVGVDLERIGRALVMTDERRRRIISAAGRLADKDGQCVGQLAADRDDNVLGAWVRLEAIAKALGTGIGQLLTEEGVVGGAGALGGSADAHRLAVRSLDVSRDYVAALAREMLPATITIAAFPGDLDALAGFLSQVKD